VRNEDDAALGFGVCTPYESTGGACTTGEFTGRGETNQLDNAGTPEMIRLTRADSYRWNTIWVSSLTGAKRGQLR
jgi:hypothetical protein